MKKFGFVTFLILLSSSLSAQAQDPNDMLQEAVRTHSPTAVKAAIKAGANPNYRTYLGSILGVAATGGDIKVVKALVENGADVNMSSSGGWTAAMGAADNGHLAVLKYLASKKADLRATTRMGRTLLMRASFHGRDAVVKYLLTKGINVNDADSSGVSALMLAAQQGNDSTVKILLKARADKTAKTQSNKIALDFANERHLQYPDYKQDQYKRTIALLSGKAAREEKLIGTVYSVNGKNLEITGKEIRKARKGSKLRIQTASGDVGAKVTRTMHSKIKASAAKSGVKKGDAVYLVK